MKRKIVNPDIQKKKKEHVRKQDEQKNLKEELEQTQPLLSKKKTSHRPQTGHK